MRSLKSVLFSFLIASIAFSASTSRADQNPQNSAEELLQWNLIYSARHKAGNSWIVSATLNSQDPSDKIILRSKAREDESFRKNLIEISRNLKPDRNPQIYRLLEELRGSGTQVKLRVFLEDINGEVYSSAELEVRAANGTVKSFGLGQRFKDSRALILSEMRREQLLNDITLFAREQIAVDEIVNKELIKYKKPSQTDSAASGVI